MNYRYLIVIFCCCLATPALADQATVKQCQRYIDQAASYEAKRRHGGNAAQMDTWKQKKRDYDQKFFSGNCKKYRRELVRR